MGRSLSLRLFLGLVLWGFWVTYPFYATDPQKENGKVLRGWGWDLKKVGNVFENCLTSLVGLLSAELIGLVKVWSRRLAIWNQTRLIYLILVWPDPSQC